MFGRRQCRDSVPRRAAAFSEARPDPMEDAMIRRVATAMVAAAVLGLLGFFPLAWRPAIASIEPPTPASFPAESIAKGATLSAAGHCAACHTRPGGQPFAVGYGLSFTGPTSFPTRRPASGAGPWGLRPRHARGRLPRRVAPFSGIPLLSRRLCAKVLNLEPDDCEVGHNHTDSDPAFEAVRVKKRTV